MSLEVFVNEFCKEHKITKEDVDSLSEMSMKNLIKFAIGHNITEYDFREFVKELRWADEEKGMKVLSSFINLDSIKFLLSV